jgi:hypothetical protein
VPPSANRSHESGIVDFAFAQDGDGSISYSDAWPSQTTAVGFSYRYNA